MRDGVAQLERVDGFGADGRLVVVMRHRVDEGGRSSRGRRLEERRAEQLALLANTPKVVTARIVPVSGDIINVNATQLASYKEAIRADES